MKKQFFLLLQLLVVVHMPAPAQPDSVAKRYIKVPAGYLMVLKPQENVLEMLTALANKEQIPSASFSAIGFAEVEFGYFNSKTKTYKSRKFKSGEIATLQGSIAWQNGQPSIHAHGVLADNQFRAHGGHILSARVGTGTMEILVIMHNTRLERKHNEALGANELCLNCAGR